MKLAAFAFALACLCLQSSCDFDGSRNSETPPFGETGASVEGSDDGTCLAVIGWDTGTMASILLFDFTDSPLPHGREQVTVVEKKGVRYEFVERYSSSTPDATKRTNGNPIPTFLLEEREGGYFNKVCGGKVTCSNKCYHLRYVPASNAFVLRDVLALPTIREKGPPAIINIIDKVFVHRPDCRLPTE